MLFILHLDQVCTIIIVIITIIVINEIFIIGGVWINLGPLLYHWASTADADSPDDERYGQSVELSWEELEAVIKGTGFTFVREKEYLNVTYAGNKKFLMWNEYKPLFFSCQKPCSST